MTTVAFTTWSPCLRACPSRIISASSSPGCSGDAMRRLVTLSRSLIGKKIIMAATGLVLGLFVVGHLLGNLKVFEGPEKFNAYAEGLRTVGAPFFRQGQLLSIVRIVLLVSAAGPALATALW